MEKFLEKSIALIIILIVLYTIFAFIFSFFPFNLIRHNTTPEKITYSYELFYDLNNQIKSYDIQIATKTSMLNTIDKSDKDMYNRVLTELNGLKAVRENTVAEYNSNSKKINKAIWKAADLPYQMQ